MSKHLVHVGCNKRPHRKVDFYNVLDITKPHNYPRFGDVVRHFTQSQKYSRLDHEAFLEAFKDNFYYETTNRRLYASDFDNFHHTLRHARKAFWKLIAYHQDDLASKLLFTCTEFMVTCCRIMKNENEVVEAQANACFDELIRFLLERFLSGYLGNQEFSSSMLKHLLIHAERASDEVTELVYVTVLEKKLSLYSTPHYLTSDGCIDQKEFARLQQIFFFLAEDVGKHVLSKKVKGLIGRLLAVLEKVKYSNSDYSYGYRYGKKIMAMNVYQASTKNTLIELRLWLDGKQPGKKSVLVA